MNMKKLNMFDLVNGFWRKAEVEKFSPSEVALYFYLLQKANLQKWQMPVCCPTETIRVFIDTTKQNVMKARDGLRRKGLITFQPGKCKGSYPQYYLLPNGEEIAPSELSGELSGELSLYKTKDKDEISNNNARKGEFCLEELERRLAADESWQQNVISLISDKTSSVPIAEVKSKLSQFFLYLKTSGLEKREETDCRRHFINWLKKNLNTDKKKNNNEKSSKNQSGTSDACHTATASYYDSF